MTRFLAMLLVVASVTPAHAGGPDSVDEVFSAWEKYETALRRQGFSGTAAHTVHATQGATTITTHATLKFACAGSAFRSEHTIDEGQKESGSGRAYGANSQYAFELGKSREGGWALRGFSTPTNLVKQVAETVGANETDVFPLLVFNSDFLPRIQDRQKLQVVRSGAEPLALNAVGLVSKSYTNTVTYHEAGWTLAPDDYAVVKSGSAKIRMNKTEGKITVSNEYRLINGLPIPTKSVVVEDYSTPQLPFTFRRETQYDVSVGGALRPEDLGLTHYGLPEPPGVVWPRSTPTYVWLLIAGVGCAVLALVCRWVLKRRAESLPTPPIPPTA